MKLWITTLVAGACLTIGANSLLAQPADRQPREGDRIRQRDGEQAGRGRGGNRVRQRNCEQAGQGQAGNRARQRNCE